MSDFDPDPKETTLSDERDEWARTQDTRTRIRAVVTGLAEPATAATVAERAHCSTNAARKHLGEFVELGIARQLDNDTGTRYVRNDAYFRWRRANDLATTRTVDQLLDDLQELEAQDEQYQDTFDASSPDAVSLPEGASHAELEDRLQAIGEWHTVRESIERHKEALRIARRGDDKLTA
ncbi:DUF7342 family protein [Halapricum hydrolyticum]|uniref:Transcriptional regulator n=1 Tax=Halapricum hydrolyticum TaxID=2979991 RepID=A0AAE3IDJ0_9EURY|nr:transcriptional regulator [Halapricum hydrolyticum]MCU4719308.1 transcriptional regulator [Halapricum hydrolyticum]MCU4728247.1 transcriptional regulator [Halapricum hydrolyticum]